MYWIYLALFVLAVLTPKAIVGTVFSVPEEEAEALFVFLFGLTGFLIYFAKEKALIRHIREKLRLQQEKHDITRDLSDSYSYIGEANRKMDVLKGLVISLPATLDRLRKGEKKSVYDGLSKAIMLFSKTDSFSLRIVDRECGRVEKEIRKGKGDPCFSLDTEALLGSDRSFWEVGGCIVARSPSSIGRHVAYLTFGKSANRIDDGEIFQAFAAEGLALFFLEKNRRKCASGNAEEKQKAIGS
jgi:hypothetical protein